MLYSRADFSLETLIDVRDLEDIVRGRVYVWAAAVNDFSSFLDDFAVPAQVDRAAPRFCLTECSSGLAQYNFEGARYSYDII